MNKFLVLGLLLLAVRVSAQESDSGRSRRAQFIPLPVLYYTPETRLGYGLLGVCLFRTDSTARTSNVDFAIIHTLNRQTVVEPTYTVFTHREHYLIRGMFLYTQFPEFYYGLGNETTDNQKELISYKAYGLTIDFSDKLNPVCSWVCNNNFSKHLMLTGPQMSSCP